MRQKNVLIAVMFAVLLVAGSFALVTTLTHAQDQGMDQSGISAKLDQVLQGQRAIMEQMTSIKQELNIIKIRVTQAQ